MKKTYLYPVRRLVPAIVVIILLATTAIAEVIPGFIQSLGSEKLTINQYEAGMVPYEMLENQLSLLRIEGLRADEIFESTKVDSLDAAVAELGFVPLVPSTFDYGEKLQSISVGYKDGEAWMLDLLYHKDRGDYGTVYSSDTIEVQKEAMNPRYFQVYQYYVGDAKVTFDTEQQFKNVVINGYEAFIDTEHMTIMWVRDGVFINVCTLSSESEERLIEIAESLVPLE